MIVVEFGQNLIDELVVSLEAELFEGVLEFLRVNDSTEIAIEDVEGLLDVLDFFDGDGEGGVVFSFPGFFFRCLRLSGGGFSGLGLSFHLD